MYIGAKIRALRQARGMTQKELASLVGISQNYLSQIETGHRRIDVNKLLLIAQALNCKPEDIIKDQSIEPDEEKQCILQPQMSSDIIFVPALSDINTVCCGEGNIYEIPEESIDYMIPVAVASLGPICTEGLFAVKVEGNSMEGAKIHDGDLVIVAPNEEPINGSVVFVCYGPQKRWMLRWYYARPDGSILLRAANPAYPDIEIGKDDIEAGWYEYVGRVVAVHSTPRMGL
ncbi:LexA family transcriptional regulator [Thermovirga sp.]|uniref:helix-turn-helix domain-containing protein n=1 Tax=Thermovirga sp. TaxID=2699834 RepID=UPI0025D4575C|nr:LexA family transcriptional regulator [Thermovirga sp.]MBO8154787.1 LexA family transcriptional regulator [Thermovirga sp.]